MPELKVFLIGLLIICLSNDHVIRTVCDQCHDCFPRAQETHVTRLCQAGKYLDKITDSCLPCQPDTYLIDDYTCVQCDVPDENFHETIITPCNATINTVIGCEEGFFRTFDPGPTCGCEGVCRPCDICGVANNLYLNYETRPCTMHSNTICCDSKDAEVDEDGHCVRPGAWFMTSTQIHDVSSIGHTIKDDAVNAHVSPGNRGCKTLSSLTLFGLHQIVLMKIASARCWPRQ